MADGASALPLLSLGRSLLPRGLWLVKAPPSLLPLALSYAQRPCGSSCALCPAALARAPRSPSCVVGGSLYLQACCTWCRGFPQHSRSFFFVCMHVHASALVF